jgi:enoyl-[acyl-carrier protein] reductase I
VADTIVFLLSDLSRGITGEMVHVDGGYHAMGSAPAVESGSAGVPPANAS